VGRARVRLSNGTTSALIPRNPPRTGNGIASVVLMNSVAPSPSPESAVGRGIASMLVAVAVFSTMDALIKWLAAT
jgi:hypothetical protein